MFVPVTFRMGDTTVYNRMLDGLSSRARDLTVPLKQIGKDLIASITAQFASQGAYAYDWPFGGGEWQPLSEEYAAWKEENYPGRPILVRTGVMRAAVLAGGARMKITPRTLLYTPADRYVTVEDKTKPVSHTYNMAEIAYFHQVGAGYNPVRPMVAFPLSELREWDRYFISWLHGREPISARAA